MREITSFLLLSMVLWLILLPARAFSQDNNKNDEELRKQWKESGDLWCTTIDELREEGQKPENRKSVIAKLEKMLVQYDKHAVKPWILFSIAELIENTEPAKALNYYLQASEFPIKTDPWGFGQQEALKKTVELYARKGEYKQAVAQLMKWEVREPCGNGRAGSELSKQFKLLELRLNYDDRNKIYSEMWQSFSGYLALTGSETPAYMIVCLYGADNLPKLKKDLSLFIENNNLLKPPPANNSNNEDYKTELLYNTTQHIKNIIKFFEDVNSADEDGIINLATTVEHPGFDPIKLTEDDFWLHNLFQWRDKLVIDKIVGFGAAIKPKLMAAYDKATYTLLLHCLVKIGGPDVVEYLIGKINSLGDIQIQHVHFYYLLSTKEEKAIKFVRDMASSGKDGKAEIARSALTQFPDLSNPEGK